MFYFHQCYDMLQCYSKKNVFHNNWMMKLFGRRKLVWNSIHEIEQKPIKTKRSYCLLRRCKMLGYECTFVVFFYGNTLWRRKNPLWLKKELFDLELALRGRYFPVGVDLQRVANLIFERNVANYSSKKCFLFSRKSGGHEFRKSQNFTQSTSEMAPMMMGDDIRSTRTTTYHPILLNIAVQMYNTNPKEEPTLLGRIFQGSLMNNFRKPLSN